MIDLETFTLRLFQTTGQYRQTIESLIILCNDNHLKLSVSKTNEHVVEYNSTNMDVAAKKDTNSTRQHGRSYSLDRYVFKQPRLESLIQYPTKSMYFIKQVTATVTSAKDFSFKVHRKALFTLDCKVPGFSSTTVLTVREARSPVFQITNSDGEGLETSGQCTNVRRACTLTDGFDSAGGGSDEGVGLPAQIAVPGRGEASFSHLVVTSVPAHLPNMLSYKTSVTLNDTCILREDGSRKQQQTSKHDPHDSLLERMWGKCSVSCGGVGERFAVFKP